MPLIYLWPLLLMMPFWSVSAMTGWPERPKVIEKEKIDDVFAMPKR
jgi:hypothetical protein